MTPPDALASHTGTDADPVIGASAGAPAAPAVGLAPGGRTRLRPRIAKYLAIFRVSLSERMTYRGDFLLATIFRFLPMITTILLWRAIYVGAGRQDSDMEGFRYNDMIAYLLLTHISRMFSSMPNLAAGISREVREGTLKRYLIQPIDMIAYLLSYRVAHKVAYIVASFLPYALLFGVCQFSLGIFDKFPDPATLAAYAVSLILAFLVGFFFEASVGMIGFWFLEVTSLLYIVMTLNFFISGQMLPLNLLPEPWFSLLKFLPFQYMAYFPAVVFLGKVKGAELWILLLGELLWAVVFMILARVLFRMGLRRYSAFGG
jgi:ABC-2 type transport system permease protein